MKSTTITFSDNSTLALTTNDSITPIEILEYNNSVPSIGKELPIEWNIHNGAIPFLLAIFSQHDYFYVNDTQSCVYNAKSIVSIVATE